MLRHADRELTCNRIRSGPENASPDNYCIDQAEEDGGAAHILGALGQFVHFW